MNKIAVTGVGGGVGQSIIKSLQNSGYDIIALDSDHLGTGLYAAPRSHIIPYAADPNYIERVLEICKKEACDLLFPGLDAELPCLAKNRHEFQKIRTTVVVSGEEVIETADNKWLTYRRLKEWGISVPSTQPLEDYIKHPQIPFPIILKPMKGGARSKDVFLVKNKERMDYVSQHYRTGVFRGRPVP